MWDLRVVQCHDLTQRPSDTCAPQLIELMCLNSPSEARPLSHLLRLRLFQCCFLHLSETFTMTQLMTRLDSSIGVPRPQNRTSLTCTWWKVSDIPFCKGTHVFIHTLYQLWSLGPKLESSYARSLFQDQHTVMLQPIKVIKCILWCSQACVNFNSSSYAPKRP